MKDPKKVKMGKASKAAGQRFEKRVREDLEKKNWIIDKWGNNVEFRAPNAEEINEALQVTGSGFAAQRVGKLIKAKPKFVFNPGLKRRIPMGMSSGFPDFIAFQHHVKLSSIIGVESKMNGILDKEEKEKCKWLLENNIFFCILIASFFFFSISQSFYHVYYLRF